MVERISETIVVTKDLDVIAKRGIDIEHVDLLREEFRAGNIEGRERLLVRYWPKSNILWFTWPNMPRDIQEGGMFEEQFGVLFRFLSDKYPQFGMRTQVDWAAGVGQRSSLGEETRPRRRPVHVRRHRRLR